MNGNNEMHNMNSMMNANDNPVIQNANTNSMMNANESPVIQNMNITNPVNTYESNKKILDMNNVVKEIFLPEYPIKKMVVSMILLLLFGIGCTLFLIKFGADYFEEAPVMAVIVLLLAIFGLVMPFISLPMYFRNKNKIVYNGFYIIIDRVTEDKINTIRVGNISAPLYETAFENLSKYLDKPIYIVPLEGENISVGDECFIFLPEKFKPTLGSYYTPIRILKTSEYTLDNSLVANVVTCEDYVQNHLGK